MQLEIHGSEEKKKQKQKTQKLVASVRVSDSYKK